MAIYVLPSLGSAALIADGYHARTDGFVSLAVVASAIVVALGFKLGDPIIGLVITLVILRITWQSIQTIKADPGLPEEAEGELDDAAGHNAPVEHGVPAHSAAGPAINSNEHAEHGHGHQH